MDKVTIHEKVDQRRRMLVGAAAVAATAIEFVTATRAEATAGGTYQANAATPGGAGISFGPLDADQKNPRVGGSIPPLGTKNC